VKNRVHILGALEFAGAIACGSIKAPPGLAAPVNACPEYSCAGYVQSGTTPASCVGGACIVPGPTDGIVLLIALPQDSGFAPGRTFALDFNEFVAGPPPSTPPMAALCATGGCATLPGYAAIKGQYGVSPNLEQLPPLGVGWDLGNPAETALPVEASFRLLWPVTSTSAVDAQTLGLPIDPVQATASVDTFGIPGPAGGPSVIYQTYLQPGLYERVLRPTPPFDQAFAPEIKVVAVVEGQSVAPEFVDAFDSTQETGQGSTIPTFNITNAGTTLEGWTAYLRDGSHQVISNVVALHGTTTRKVILATNHVATGVDALTNAELVVAPPLGAAFPTGLFAPVGNVLPPDEVYPALASPMDVSGAVITTGGAPAAADIIFEALAITGANGASYTTNFEFVGRASTDPDPVSGDDTYSAILPQGRYRVSVRPRSAASQVTIFDPFVVDGMQGATGTASNFVVDVPRTAEGTAVVADGRPLAGATVEASPVGCIDGTSSWCLPRAAQTTTADSGAFRLALDPGQYVLRVRPADGSRLPWVVQPLSVPLDNFGVIVSSIKVPAPMSVGLSLFDPIGNAIVHAVVRAFWLPSQGSAVELGSTLTGTDGRYDMYLALPSR
jgi:hypothetical protein